MAQVGNDEFPKTLEDINTTDDYIIKRLRVPGGWLVLVRDTQFSTSFSEFIGDPHHEWTLES